MPSMDDEKWKDDMLAALKTIKGKMGYVRTLAKDELEKAKFDIGLNKRYQSGWQSERPNVSKRK